MKLIKLESPTPHAPAFARFEAQLEDGTTVQVGYLLFLEPEMVWDQDGKLLAKRGSDPDGWMTRVRTDEEGNRGIMAELYRAMELLANGSQG